MPHGVTPTPWRILFEHDTHKVKRDARGRILGPVSLPFEDYQHACDCVNQHARLLAEREKLRATLEALAYICEQDGLDYCRPFAGQLSQEEAINQIRFVRGTFISLANVARAALKETGEQ